MLLFLPLNFSYAEIHYTVAGIKPLYYQKSPEIIFDAPVRCLTSRSDSLPIALIVKDAHLFPAKIYDLKLIIHSEPDEIITLDLNSSFNKPFEYMIFHIPLQNKWYDKKISFDLQFSFQSGSLKKTMLNDNYTKLKKLSFSCFIDNQPRTFDENYFLGDPHYHSSFTSDQVEFGAPLEITALFAYTMGLDWFFSTDHSYDLDDFEDNYLKNDPDLSKWNKYSNLINKISNDKLNISLGEEVSIGNRKNQNVHLLLINYPEFVHGKGDSGEIWFKNSPDSQITELKKHKNTLTIAAHPFEKIPLSQKLTLNRGQWSLKDYNDNNIDLLQAVNQNSPTEVFKSISIWSKFLLQNHRFYILAGNDAHGNFQFMKQIKTPYLSLFISKKQIFGQFFTAFKYHSNSPVQAVNNHHIIISNGPFIDFYLSLDKKYYIGNEYSNPSSPKLFFLSSSNLEFGIIKTIKFFIGDIDKKKETCIINPKSGFEIDLPIKGYVRMECLTDKMALAFTNPIWIKRVPQ